ncbi:MAG: lysophospholipid acyltransferase family protein [Candidatus Sigynarchaeum springense]
MTTARQAIHWDDGKVPFPWLNSWMHQRIPLQENIKGTTERKHGHHHEGLHLAESLLTRFVKRTHLLRHRWVTYRIVMGVVHVYMRIFHRLQIRGEENIPKGGAIFYLLHNGDNDVIIFLGAFKKPIGVFTDIGTGLFPDFMERFFGFVTRRGTREVMVEKMIRTIWQKNKYFVIWPEGTPSRDGRPQQGFSGIVRVYATLNARKDIIPFVPVLARGGEIFRNKNSRRLQKYLVEYLKPIYIPRGWLAKPEDGGKTPREIIDALMLVLARKVGYTTLKQNYALERRRHAGGRPWRE